MNRADRRSKGFHKTPPDIQKHRPFKEPDPPSPFFDIKTDWLGRKVVRFLNLPPISPLGIKYKDKHVDIFYVGRKNHLYIYRSKFFKNLKKEVKDEQEKKVPS